MAEKLELTFKTDHADLLRNDAGELVVHLIGVDEDELNQSVAGYKQAVVNAQAALQQRQDDAAALNKLLHPEAE